MKINLRFQILVPLVLTVLGAGATTGLIGYQASTGGAQVEHVVQNAFLARETSLKTEQQFKEATEVVDRVLAMTTYISAETVKQQFETADGNLAASVSALRTIPLSEAVSGRVDAMAAAHTEWQQDARAVLGLADTNAVPTNEKLKRSVAKVRQEIGAVNDLIGLEASRQIEAAQSSLADRIELELSIAAAVGFAGIIALFMIAQRISTPISTMAHSMRSLAGGNSDIAVSGIGRKDEIGEMAQALEVFRQAAIVNKELQADAEANRQKADADRIRVTAEAEAAAHARLDEATSGLAAGLRRLASGDLSFKLDTPFSAQFEALRHDLNGAVGELGQTLRSVASAADAIDCGSREVSKSADDLSGRTEQQAASLEETAAALDQITSNVSNSSQRAEEARTVAVQANASAIESGKVVARAVEAMGKIETSSSEVSNIIAVIDEIAFQTNLLALNAGVEAARAGEAGKGFAVVAQEVRELAQRSAKAAKEIKDLIRNASTEVRNGVAMVSDTGKSLKTIESYIVTINQHMDAITTAAREQSIGLSEVNAAVNRMDHVTQQNAAMVEETSAAGTTLAEESSRLRELINRFNLSGSSYHTTVDHDPSQGDSLGRSHAATVENRYARTAA